MKKPELQPAERSRNGLVTPEEERFFNEINLLRLEGYYFCLDPKASIRYTRKREFVERIKTPQEVLERPLSIEPHPNYGYPSVLAYKVLQAIMKKLSEYGFPIAENISFSQRELARLIGRASFGGKDSRELFQASMQLNSTKVWCSFYDKETKEWKVATFYIIDSCLFSGKKDHIHQCVFQLSSIIVKNLNSRHAFWINYLRIEGLEPITTALYKHLFYHFSNIFSQVRNKDFTFNKDYADICTQWLGGLTVLRYKSKILSEQLGKHFTMLKDRGLISKYTLTKRVPDDKDGFTFTFSPGKTFFEDYRRFYGGQLELQFTKAVDDRKIQLPMAVVHYFYKKLYQTDDTGDLIFSDKEVAFASSLLENQSFEEVQTFIDYGLAEAKKTAFEIKTLMGIKQYYPGFLAYQKANGEAEEQTRRRVEERAQRDFEAQYWAFRKAKLSEARTHIHGQELEVLEATARDQVATRHPYKIGQEILVRIEVERLLAQKYQVPSFEKWHAQQTPSPSRSMAP